MNRTIDLKSRIRVSRAGMINRDEPVTKSFDKLNYTIKYHCVTIEKLLLIYNK